MNAQASRILVVDDEEHLAFGISENLLAEGYRTDVAFDGREALERLHDVDYDLVVLDIMMPELDGLEVCRLLRAERKEVPILFLTARSGLDDRIRGLEAGRDDYLPKPLAIK